MTRATNQVFLERSSNSFAEKAGKVCSIFSKLFLSWPQKRREKIKLQNTALAYYLQIVEQARSPLFYTKFNVADTLDGRFELIVLHLSLLIIAFKQRGLYALNQHLFDVMMMDMDRSLREMGVGDLKVGKEVKLMAQGFNGRIKVYEQALQESNQGQKEKLLYQAIFKNIFSLNNLGNEKITIEKFAQYIIIVHENIVNLICLNQNDPVNLLDVSQYAFDKVKIERDIP